MIDSAVIRPYRSSDDADLCDVCMRTADAGQDARARYADQTLLPDIFARPYAVLDPGLAFVAEHAGRVVGYILGTADTTRFVSRFRDEWLPIAGPRHRPPPPEPDWAGDAEGAMAFLLHTPELMLVPDLAPYPAHLHIDLLPDYQRHGLGKALMHIFLDAADAEGAPAVHLAMLKSNTEARLFYNRLGFEEITITDQPDNLTYLVRPTAR